VSWLSTRHEGLGEVKEHEADDVVREEQVSVSLGHMAPSFFIFCANPFPSPSTVAAETDLGFVLG
jgi:hypothetical protein